jgi:hypothetical protein
MKIRKNVLEKKIVYRPRGSSDYRTKSDRPLLLKSPFYFFFRFTHPLNQCCFHSPDISLCHHYARASRGDDQSLTNNHNQLKRLALFNCLAWLQL